MNVYNHCTTLRLSEKPDQRPKSANVCAMCCLLYSSMSLCTRCSVALCDVIFPYPRNQFQKLFIAIIHSAGILIERQLVIYNTRTQINSLFYRNELIL